MHSEYGGYEKKQNENLQKASWLDQRASHGTILIEDTLNIRIENVGQDELCEAE